jgi:hypothetical protein
MTELQFNRLKKMIELGDEFLSAIADADIADLPVSPESIFGCDAIRETLAYWKGFLAAKQAP